MISAFAGREEDLSLMEKEREKDIGSFVIIYGRRRVGKTGLVLEVSKGDIIMAGALANGTGWE